MREDAELVTELEVSVLKFKLALKSDEGFPEGQFERVCEVLRRCIEKWANVEVVPKRAALVFLDLTLGIESCASGYDAERMDLVMNAADQATELARMSVKVEDSGFEV